MYNRFTEVMKLLRALGLSAGLVFMGGVAAAASGSAAHATPKDAAPILIDFPEPGSIFPPDITPPTFLWRETTGGAIAWRVEVLFGERGGRVKENSPGEKPRVGEIDASLVGYVPPTLTAEQEAQHTWKPGRDLWEKIKKQSQKHPATLVITGFRDARLTQPVSSGRSTFETSMDPVGAPIFYRDVPLIPPDPSERERGIIHPLSDSVLPKIQWRIRYINETSSKTVMENLPTCANCHSISRDGSTLGIDVDGPQNDKGLYDFWGFGQVFYPTRGILAWYSKATQKLQPLAGADDPEYVQTCAFWSPDQSFIVFARAKARDPYPPGEPPSRFANDPNETQIQYDLYRIPFNEGRGGKPERIVGASENGMSNDFPKVSPDGRWIVWVQNKNGLLMRPDSKLYIVSSSGGEARPLRSNQKTMNSWHSFSPNGRWLVFSSKTPTPYTRLYLTHIDQDGNSSPAIPIDDATAANRAVNIPEFMNLGPEGLDRIDAPATDFYKEFNMAADLSEKHDFVAAVPAWKKAVELNPEDARAHNNLGTALMETGKPEEALMEYRRSLELNDQSSQAHNNLGSILAQQGKLDEALEQFERAVELNPDNGRAQSNLGGALSEKGRTEAALEHLRKGVALDPKFADGQNNLGAALARAGELDEAIPHMATAVDLAPQSAGNRYNYGRVLAAKGRFADAAAQFEQAANLTGMREPAILDILAAMYAETGRYPEAVATARKALDLAGEQRDAELAASLRSSLERYEALARGAGGGAVGPRR